MSNVNKENLKKWLDKKNLKYIEYKDTYFVEQFTSNKFDDDEDYYFEEETVEILDFDNFEITDGGYVIFKDVTWKIKLLYDCKTGTTGYIKATYGGDDSLFNLLHTLTNITFKDKNITIGYWIKYTDEYINAVVRE
jgi:hypothetical protein